MKIKLNLMVFFVFVYVFLMMQPLFVFGELIEPSRTVKGHEKANGRLSVFSEPPGLYVLLDDINIGKTPVIAKQVAPGTHVLRVKETEKEITTLPEKSLKMSFFKGSLIELPEKKTESLGQSKSEEKSTTSEKQTEDSKKEKKQLDPFYFPTNPSGPIR